MTYSKHASDFIQGLVNVRADAPFDPVEFFSHAPFVKAALGISPNWAEEASANLVAKLNEQALKGPGTAADKMGPAAHQGKLPNPTGAHGGGVMPRGSQR